MEKALSTRVMPTSIKVETVQEVTDLGRILAGSGLFADTKQVSQAVVKIMAGMALSIDPVQSMNNIHIIQGKITMGSGIIASAIKRSGKYDYKIVTLDEEQAHLEFHERTDKGWEKIGNSYFTYEDAKKAKLTNKPVWNQFRRNMLFARALTNGARWYTPDVFGGPIYTPEELGSSIVDVESPTEITVHKEDTDDRPLDPQDSKRKLIGLMEFYVEDNKSGSKEQLRRVVDGLTSFLDTKEIQTLITIFDKSSIKDLTSGELSALITWLDIHKTIDSKVPNKIKVEVTNLVSFLEKETEEEIILEGELAE